MPAEPLRALHWNIHSWTDDTGHSNVDTVADLINRLSPDVVSLVEVDEAGPTSANLDEVARRTGLASVFVPAFEYGTEPPRGSFGNAILTRLPILAVRQHHLISPPPVYDGTEPSEPRTLLLTRLSHSSGPVWIGSTHLPRTDNAARAKALPVPFRDPARNGWPLRGSCWEPSVVAEDGFSERYGDLLDGCYDCVDRVVLNAYYPLGHNPGGFRTWWRRLNGGDGQLDNAHLMRMAGRFARRVRASAHAHGIPVIDCKRGERKHEIAEDYLAEHTMDRGVFLILVARAVAPVWNVARTPGGKIANLAKKRAFVNHYSFHIMDPEWGHMTIKMSGHPPFGAQIILNGHEYVAAQARAAGIGFVKEGNCFTRIADTTALARIADTLSQPATIGRLAQVCDRWIYTACLCFGLDADEQVRSGFGYGYAVYQAEYSRNLLFTVGAQMDRVFDRVVDRTRSRLDVPTLRTLFGAKQRPGRNGAGDLSLRLAAVIETPRHDLTLFKLHFGNLTLKAYTKGEHALRFEAVVHNTRALRCGRVLDNFPTIIARLAAMVDRFTTTLDCVDHTFIGDDLLDRLRPRSAPPGSAGST